ncbi:hypothetical protein BGX33_012506 [Mortierella sp. NVP41]|nr:hypothetical protein BGX33_012506 [Mortierella sp. NVP41]
MVRISYRDPRVYREPSIQGLQAIDCSTDILYTSVVEKYDSPPCEVITAGSVVDLFGGFEHIKRYRQHGTWEALPRWSVQIQSRTSAYPAYPQEVLYVAQAKSVPQVPDTYSVEVMDENGTQSFPDPGQTGYYNTSFPASNSLDPYSSLEHSMENWTLSLTAKDIRLQPPFFVLPKGVRPNQDIDPSVDKFKMFLLCNHPRAEHDSIPHQTGVSGIDIKRPAEFLEKYKATLLWSLQAVKGNLQDMSGRPGVEIAESFLTATQLQSDLELSSVENVEPLVDKMIALLQRLRPQESLEGTLGQRSSKDRPLLSSHDVAVLPSYLESHPNVPQVEMLRHGLFFDCDANGREQWVCSSCYQLLHPLHSTEYVMVHVGDLGEYDSQMGRIVLRPQNREELKRLCRLDVTKTGCLTELTVDMDRDPPQEDLESIHQLAAKLNLTSLTITTTNLTEPENTGDGLLPYSASSDEPQEAQLAMINRFTQTLVDGLTHLSVVSDKELDVSAFLPSLSTPSNGIQVVRVKELSSSYLAATHNDTIQILELETSLADALRISTQGPLVGRSQSITITDFGPTLTEEALSSKTQAIKTILRNNSGLVSLTLHLSANGFLKAETMMESILADLASEQVTGPRLSRFTLVDNSDDHISATFKLPNCRATKSIIVNVTVRTYGSGLDSVLLNYGPFIRILNTNDKLGSHIIGFMGDSIGREGHSQLTDITIVLSDLDKENSIALQSTLQSSKATLRQLVLVGRPLDDDVSQVLLSTLEKLEVNRVILFNDGSDMERWTGQMLESLPSSTSLTVLDQVDDLRRIVPGHDETSLTWYS